MSEIKLSRTFTNRIDNTNDVDVLRKELLVMQRIKRDTEEEDVREEISLKIKYVMRRLDYLSGQKRIKF